MKLLSALVSEVVLTAPSLRPKAAHCAIAEFFPSECPFCHPLFITVVHKKYGRFESDVLILLRNKWPTFLGYNSHMSGWFKLLPTPSG